jgi:hypothetical protein
MPSLRIIHIAVACIALGLMAEPAMAQKMTKDQAFAACKQELGRGVSGDSFKQQMQACVKRKMSGRK